MINKKKQRKNNRNRNQNSRSGRGKRSVNTTAYNGVPDEYSASLKYVYAVSDTASTPYGEVIIRGNGPYDPEYATGGGQPLWWDQVSAPYTRYQCYAAKCTAEFTQRTASTEAAFIRVGIYPLVEPTSVLGTYTASERDDSVCRSMGPNTGGDGVVKLTKHMTTANMYGVSQQFAKDDLDYSSAINSTPSFQWYFHVFYGTMDETTNVSIYVTITTEYKIRFFNKDDIGASLSTRYILPSQEDSCDHYCGCRKCLIASST